MGPARILIVEDNAEVAGMLRELLRQAGYDAVVAVNGAEALARLQERDFDLIISDLAMPELDGAGLYRALARNHPRYAGRLIFMTGQQDPAALAFLEGTVVPVLHKPFSMREVGREIRHALAATSAPGHVPAR